MNNLRQMSVGVVIPIRDGAKFLSEAIESLERQLCAPHQVVVVDDGSSQREVSSIRTIVKRTSLNIKLIESGKNGVANARNIGAHILSTDLLCFMDSDDIWAPEKLSRQVASPAIGRGAIVTSNYLPWNISSKTRKPIKFDWSHRRTRLWSRFLGPGPLIPSTMMIRTEDFAKLNGFRENLGTLADLDFGLRAFDEFEMSYVDLPIVRYRMHAGQMHRKWTQVQDDLVQMSPSDYSLTRNLTKDYWLTLARTAFEWYQLSRGLSKKPKSAASRLMALESSLGRRYALLRLREELKTPFA